MTGSPRQSDPSADKSGLVYGIIYVVLVLGAVVGAAAWLFMAIKPTATPNVHSHVTPARTSERGSSKTSPPYAAELDIADLGTSAAAIRERNAGVLQAAFGETSYGLTLTVPYEGGLLDYFVLSYAETANANICFSRQLLRGGIHPDWHGRFSGPMLADLLTSRGCVAGLEDDDVLYFRSIDQESVDPGAEKMLPDEHAARKFNTRLPEHFVPVQEVFNVLSRKGNLRVSLKDAGSMDSVLIWTQNACTVNVLNALGRTLGKRYDSINIIPKESRTTSATLTSRETSSTE